MLQTQPRGLRGCPPTAVIRALPPFPVCGSRGRGPLEYAEGPARADPTAVAAAAQRFRCAAGESLSKMSGSSAAAKRPDLTHQLRLRTVRGHYTADPARCPEGPYGGCCPPSPGRQTPARAHAYLTPPTPRGYRVSARRVTSRLWAASNGSEEGDNSKCRGGVEPVERERSRHTGAGGGARARRPCAAGRCRGFR